MRHPLLKLIQDRNKERGRVFLFLPAVGVVVHHLFFTSFSYCIERKNSFFGNQNSLEALVMKTSPTEEQHVIIMDFFFFEGGGIILNLHRPIYNIRERSC